MKKNVLGYAAVGMTVCALALGGSLTALADDSVARGPGMGRGGAPAGFADGERPEPPEGFTEGERPEPPEGFTEGEQPEPPEGEGGGGMTADFSSLVADGLITQEQADLMTAYMEEHFAAMQAEREAAGDSAGGERPARAEGEERPDMFAELVSAGVITQSEYEAITAFMPEPSEMGGEPGEGGRGHMDFSQFVTDGVIDQATADAIAAYMEEQAETRKPEMDAMKDMTEDERQAFFESNKDTERPDMFAEMVTAGVITQEQADALNAAMPERPENDGDMAADGDMKGGGRGQMNFDNLVENGIISQATADAMTAYMEAQHETRRAEMETTTGTTEGTGGKDGQRLDIFAEMVSAGIITQEQADAISAAQPARPERGQMTTNEA